MFDFSESVVSFLPPAVRGSLADGRFAPTITASERGDELGTTAEEARKGLCSLFLIDDVGGTVEPLI